MNSYKLKNNIEVNILPETNTRTSVICFVAQSGLAVENIHFINGINHILEQLLFTGTDKYTTGRNLAIYMESLGANVQTNVTFESLQIYIEVPDYNLAKVITLLADIIQNSHFEQNDIEQIKKNVKEKYFANQESGIGYNSGKSFIQRFFYYNDIIKANRYLTLESLMNIRREDCLDYLSSQFQPSFSKLFVMGNVGATNQITELIEQEWGSWSNKSKQFIESIETRSEKFPLELPSINYRQRGSYFAELNVAFLIDNMPQSRFIDSDTGEFFEPSMMKTLIPEFVHDYAKIVLLNQVLGVGLASKLHVKTVEEDMLFNHVESDFFSFKNLQYIDITGYVENTQFTFALESLLSVLESLKRSTISIHEITRNKDILKAKLTLMHDNKLYKALWVVENYISTGIILDLESFILSIYKIQANELRSLALDVFLSNRLAIFVSGTAKESKIVNKLVNRYLGSY